MGLRISDAIPLDIDSKTAYLKIRSWYQANINSAPSNNYGTKSRTLIKGLKPGHKVCPGEISMVMREVITGLLEWGYHASDGEYKMAAYAHFVLRYPV